MMNYRPSYTRHRAAVTAESPKAAEEEKLCKIIRRDVQVGMGLEGLRCRLEVWPRRTYYEKSKVLFWFSVSQQVRQGKLTLNNSLEPRWSP